MEPKCYIFFKKNKKMTGSFEYFIARLTTDI